MNINAKSGLAGTKTEQNLKSAASNEALAHVRYTIFSDIAKESGQLEASRKFSELAGHEKEHAELWLSYLDELADTNENLDNSVRSEKYESDNYYPAFSEIAKEEGFAEISDKFKKTGEVESHHSKELKHLSDAITDGTLYKDTAETNWVCTNCGYHTKGNMPPERCPLCSYPKEYFSKHK